MDGLYPIALRVIAAVALLYFGLGLFNVPWLMRVQILASLSIGALIIAAGSYSFIKPQDPLGAISLFTGEISTVEAGLVIGLGLIAGIVATLACWPMGNVLGPYAAPAGVAVLALCSGGIKQLLLTNSSLEQRNALYSFLRAESLFWLAVCAAGYIGTLLTAKLTHKKALILDHKTVPLTKSNQWTNALIAAVIAAAIVYFTIGIFAQDIRQIDTTLGSVTGTPGNRQIAFGVFVSVGLAAFVAKRFLQAHFIPVVLGAIGLYIGVFTKIIGSEILSHMVKTWPVDVFSHTLYAITPIQFIPFTLLGAMTGYWIAIRSIQEPSAENMVR